ncbi:MAG: tetratricopeptide repeat protein [Sneathiella sp.]
MQDRYGNNVSSTSQTAVDAYVDGVDLFLEAQAGGDAAFERAIAEDPSFALAHVALARFLQSIARPVEAKAALETARALAPSASAREQAHISILGHVIEGRGAQAFAEINTHIREYPRDAMAVQPCAGVFSLIGFSGRPGREAESLAFFTALQPAYGDDWWFESILAFAQTEIGQLAQAEITTERAYQANPNNANSAHYKSHFHYEVGDIDTGLAFLKEWRPRYDRAGILHCHLSWHEALWALETGDTEAAWRIADADVRPGFAWGPPVNVVTDMAAFLLRAEYAGEARRDDLWQELSQYASTFFANPGISFADAHVAIAHALTGDDIALRKLQDNPPGPAGDMVKVLADAFANFAKSSWPAVISGLVPIMSSHERLGGSRAQRDLVEFTLLIALMKNGQVEEARRLLSMRRPHIANANYIAGLTGG